MNPSLLKHMVGEQAGPTIYTAFNKQEPQGSEEMHKEGVEPSTGTPPTGQMMERRLEAWSTRQQTAAGSDKERRTVRNETAFVLNTVRACAVASASCFRIL